MDKLDKVFSALRAEAEAHDAGEFADLADRAAAQLDGSPERLEARRRRRLIALCAGASLMIGGGAGLLPAYGKAPASDSPLSPAYELSANALFNGAQR